MNKKKKKNADIRVNVGEIPKEWNEVRKKAKLKWHDIIRLGASCALEQIEKAKSPVKKTPVKEDAIKPLERDALQTKADKRRHLSTSIIEMPLLLSAREYNVFNKLKRMWVKIEFKDILEAQIFRILEGGKVITVGGHKYLSYLGYAYKNGEGDLCARVIGRQMHFS